MHAYARLAIAILAVAGCASGISSAEAQLAEGGYPCNSIRTPEDDANCPVWSWPRSKCSGTGDEYDACIAAERNAVRSTCEVHVTFSDYADCVGIGENRIGGWPSSGDDDE
jgi:hypothetical protein